VGAKGNERNICQAVNENGDVLELIAVPLQQWVKQM
jgi:hypothetical protein